MKYSLDDIPGAYPYICAVTPLSSEDVIPENLKYAMYTMESDSKDEGIYIVEDSEIDLGLIVSVERNLERYLEIVTELLNWHEFKINEKPEKETEKEYVPEFPPKEERPEAQEKEAVKKKGFFGRIAEKIKNFFRKKAKRSEQRRSRGGDPGGGDLSRDSGGEGFGGDFGRNSGRRGSE